MVSVIGAGLAGCEAAWQISKQGINVRLFEMKPIEFTPAHKIDSLAELVCSNSLRSNQIENAVGLLKEEMRMLDSLIIKTADETKVPAGGALAVDREKFSEIITSRIEQNELIEVVRGRVIERLPDEGVVIIATGPLTQGGLNEEIKNLVGSEYLHFFDASAPIVSFDSIDMTKAYKASRYGKGNDDYINCPLEKEEYEEFVSHLIKAQAVSLKEFEDRKVFEGCMPVEVMAKRGVDTLRFGPLKPVGLVNPHTGKEPYAVVQLRQDNKEGSLFNLVGFQTHLKWPEQKRVFSKIPGLENAKFQRYGVMHRNTFINSPNILDDCYRLIKDNNIYFAGQITGVEGYVESASSGFVAGLNAALAVKGLKSINFPSSTAIGALSCYISDTSISNFQPMNVNFGILPQLDKKYPKKIKKQKLSERAMTELNNLTDRKM